MEFAHLHNHTQFSLLDGANDVEEMIKKAAENGQKGVALTDHGNMFGAFTFSKTAKKHGIKPVIGCEFYLVNDRRKKSFSHGTGQKDIRYHQLLLAKNEQGYRNLSYLCSLGYTEGLYGKFPRIDKELIEKYYEGLIATSCCIGAEIPQAIIHGKESEAEKKLRWWHDLFGDDFYIELQRHAGLENIDGTGISQEYVNQVLLGFGQKYGIKVIATNDAHYLDREDADAHDILLCINTKKFLKEENRFKFSSSDYYFKTSQEMEEIFSDIPEALANTQEIIDKVQTPDLAKDVILPKFPIPEPFKNESRYLRHLTYEGAKKRYGEITEKVQQRIDYELEVIDKSGYPGYFLITHDVTSTAQNMGVVIGPGRGSAAGSVVAYCLQITNIDPLKYDLLFERFLNPDRIGMPDIDIDIDDVRRSEVLKYVAETYGKHNVSQIITYGTLGGKSAIKDVARVMELPLAEANLLSNHFPNHPKATLKNILNEEGIDQNLYNDLRDEQREQVNKLVNKYQSSPRIKEVLDMAKKIEGNIRSTGVHACGVIITPGNIFEHIPVAVTKSKDNEETLITQFDNNVIESAGMLKMDFLGLRTLSIIRDAVEMINERHNEEVDIEKIPLDDQKTYRLFQKGETTGIFQFESPGMQKHMINLVPTKFSDLVAMNALYRPGPMQYIDDFIARKHGRKQVSYDLPCMDKYLEETYGITVYQEQVMLLAEEIAGFSKGEADILRKAMGKKKRKELEKLEEKFMEGSKARGHDLNIIKKIWKDWEHFASYAFNKSHATCYAYIGYQTAWLKAHFPEEFMASVLKHCSHDMKKLQFFLSESARMGLEIKGPSVNESDVNYSVNTHNEIVIGLSAIKGVGEKISETISSERKENGLFEDIIDFVKRLDPEQLNKKVMDAFASAGAFDDFGLYRSQYYAPMDESEKPFLEVVAQYGAEYQKSDMGQQVTLFGGKMSELLNIPTPPPAEPWSVSEKLRREKEVVGMFISGHPLDQFKHILPKCTDIDIARLLKLQPNNVEVKIAGIVSEVYHGVSRHGDEYCRFVIGDEKDEIKLGLYRENYLKYGSLLKEGQCVCLIVFCSPNRGGGIYYKVEKVQLLSSLHDKLLNAITFTIPVHALDEDVIEKMNGFCEKYPGEAEMKISLHEPKKNETVELISSDRKVNLNRDAIRHLNTLGLKYHVN